MKHSKQQPLIVIGAGGTGGHIFPAEALIRALLQEQYHVCLMTDSRGVNFTNLDHTENFQVIKLSGGGVAAMSKIQKIRNLWGLFKAVGHARKWFKQHKPDAAIGFGGFASIPAMMAAKQTKTPYMIHEQNAVLGRANRLVSKNAAIIATGFAHVDKLPSDANQQWTGNPLRPAFFEEFETSHSEKLRLLILGGSQGAKFFNQIIPEALSLLPTEYQQRIEITQQVRSDDMDETKKLWENLSITPILSPFFDNVALLMQQSDLYIGRSGAGAITECLASNLPSIMIPYPYAVDDHQFHNAQNIAHAGCGIVCRQEALDAPLLAQYIQQYLDNPSLLEQQRALCAQNAKKDATKELAHLVSTMIKTSNN